MAAPYNNVLTKLESAASAVYAATATSPLARFTGINDATMTVPGVTFAAQQGDEFPQGSSNFRCTLTITVMSSVDETTPADHRTAAARCFDVFLRDDTASLLSGTTGAQTDFHVLGVNNPRMSERTQERLHISELELECYAAATDM